MKIFIEGGYENKPALSTLSNELYGRMYASRGIRDFYYGFTAFGTGYEKNFSQISFDGKSTQALTEFIKIVGSRFKIFRVEAEDEELEQEAIAAWEKEHTQNPIPKKVALPLVILRLPAEADTFEIFGKNYRFKSRNGKERLIVTNKYTSEGLADAKSRFHLVNRDEYKTIHDEFGAPEEPEAAVE